MRESFGGWLAASTFSVFRGQLIEGILPDQTLLLSNFEAIPARTAVLCLERWPVILELVQSMRSDDNGETA